jgi:hypothetical protein
VATASTTGQVTVSLPAFNPLLGTLTGMNVSALNLLSADATFIRDCPLIAPPDPRVNCIAPFGHVTTTLRSRDTVGGHLQQIFFPPPTCGENDITCNVHLAFLLWGPGRIVGFPIQPGESPITSLTLDITTGFMVTDETRAISPPARARGFLELRRRRGRWRGQ